MASHGSDLSVYFQNGLCTLFGFFFDFFTYKKWPFFRYFENVHVSLVSFQKIEKVVGFQVPRKVYQI